MVMTSTEEIVVCGEDFIERRIYVGPQPGEVENLQRTAYGCGYSRGWMRGFITGLALLGLAMFCIWLATRW